MNDRKNLVEWRIVADFVARKSLVFLGASVLYLIISLPIYIAPGFTGTGLIMLVLSISLAILGAEVSFIAPAGNSGRSLAQLPVEKKRLARTHWFVGVAVPALWICGLTVVVSPLAANGSRFTWLSVILTCSAALALVAIHYCLSALRLNLRRLAWRKVAGTAGLLPVAIFTIGLGGGTYLLVQWVDSGRWRFVVWVLSAAVAASLIGFARMHAVITAERSTASPSRAGLSSNSGRHWMFLRRLGGFPSIAATAVGIPVLMGACVPAGLLLARGLVYLMGMEPKDLRIGLPANVPGSLFAAFFVFYAFMLTVDKLFVPRVMLTLPLSPRQISVRVTALVFLLVLVQLALAAIGAYAVGISADIPLLFALLGGIGVGSFSIPGVIAAGQRLGGRLIAFLGTMTGLLVWFLASPRMAALEAIACVVFVAGFLLSTFLSRQVIVRNQWLGHTNRAVNPLHVQGSA